MHGPPGVSPVATRIVGWAVALVVIAGCSALGTWQLSRMHEKQAMLDAVGGILRDRTPVALAAAGEAARSRDYDWSAGDGRFADADAFVLDNQIHDGRPGLRIYRLFDAADGTRLLVDLGWTPIEDRASRMPAAAVRSGEDLRGRAVHVRGLLAPPPSAGLALGEAIVPGDGAWLMTRFDAYAIEAAAGLDTPPRRVLRLDPGLGFGYARDLEVLPNTLTPDKHLGYAVQWFGLALAALVTALVLTFRSRRR